MKSIIVLITLFLVFSCEKKRQDDFSKSDSINVAIDSAAVNIDSSNIENLKQKEVKYEEPADGRYSQLIKDKDISAEIFYTIKEGKVDYYNLKVYSNKNVQNIKAVSDWEFSNVNQLEFSFQDANFDGTNDLTISKEVGMNWYTLNVWINKNGRFVKEKEFDKIYNPVFDKKKKEINSDYRVSGTGEFWSTYEWKKNKLVRTGYSEEIYGPDGN